LFLHNSDRKLRFRISAGSPVILSKVSAIFVSYRMGGCGLKASGSGQRTVEGLCEHGNETSGSIKGGEFLD